MKKRLDTLLVERGLVSGRDRAKGFIMAGQVFVDNQIAAKPGAEVDEDSRVELRGRALPYVSRGGLKLERAVAVFPVALGGAVCADIGASTGGFTDCMLQNGAARVYAVDVGYGQLAWKLRGDSRVVVLERTNIRHVTRQEIPEPLDFIGADVSFISLTLVLPVAHRLLREGGEAVCLIKPQFEAGRDQVGKRGVVREPSIHVAVVERVTAFARSIGLSPAGLTFSPVKGPEGNIEYLVHLRKIPGPSLLGDITIRDVVTAAHDALREPS